MLKLPTRKDLAKETGCSRATVGDVLGGGVLAERYREETRHKTMAAVRELIFHIAQPGRKVSHRTFDSSLIIRISSSRGRVSGVNDPFRSRMEAAVSAGFTLIEMLAAVAILAVLAASLYGGMEKFIMAGNGAVCAGNMRQFGRMLMAYATENGGYLPGAPLRDTLDAEGKTISANFSGYYIKSYLGTDYAKELPMCPSFRFDPSKLNGLTQKQKAKAYGGGYAIIGLFLSGNMMAMPPFWKDTADPYAASRMPFVAEGVYGNCIWVPGHLGQTLTASRPSALWGANMGARTRTL